MQVKEILRVKGSRLLSIEPSGRAADAVSIMAKENLGSLVVLEQGRMVGMLSFHELLRAIASRNGSLGDLKVSDIMVRDPVTAAPEMEVNDLRRTMLESGARYLPVIQDGKLLGVISFRDVAKAVLEEQDFENKMLKGYIKNWPA
jgi:CBS domain-containing protein